MSARDQAQLTAEKAGAFFSGLFSQMLGLGTTSARELPRENYTLATFYQFDRRYSGKKGFAYWMFLLLNFKLCTANIRAGCILQIS